MMRTTGGTVVRNIRGICGCALSASAPVCKIGSISGSKSSTNAPCAELVALLVASYPHMPPCMKLGKLLVAHYCMLSANSAITDIWQNIFAAANTSSSIEHCHKATKPFLAKLISTILDFL